jgi:hypothetical protein
VNVAQIIRQNTVRLSEHLLPSELDDHTLVIGQSSYFGLNTRVVLRPV